MPFFSIIVPVYKVENYLTQCLESVLQQTFDDFEIILIDDGSPDKSGIICDLYAEKYSKIRVIHKENGGLSSARNCGLSEATGEYVIFLDSDDFWDKKNALESINYEIEQTHADVILLKHRKFNETNGLLEECLDVSATKDLLDKSYSEQLEFCVSKQLFDTCAWNKVFRRELIKKRDMFFVEGIISEDLDWTARLSLVATSLAIVKEPIYVYRKGRAGSITSSLKLKNLVDTKDSIERCLSYVPEADVAFLKGYYGYVAYRYVIWMAESAVLKDSGKKMLISEMKKYVWLLEYDSNPKVKLAKKIKNIFGFVGSAKILGLYLKSKK